MIENPNNDSRRVRKWWLAEVEDATGGDVRERDAGGREDLLDGAGEHENIAEGGDLDGAPDAGGAQRGRDARGHAAGVGVGRKLALLKVPPHRHFDLLAFLLLLLELPPPPLAAAVGRTRVRAEPAKPPEAEDEDGASAARKRLVHGCDHRRRSPRRRHGQLEAVAG